jgi:AraC-like DNA-binding protein/quercetin dioxygenase-like cupin family protein
MLEVADATRSADFKEFVCVFEAGATHVSEGAATSRHAHYAWKVLIGIDAPVWFESNDRVILPSDGVRAIVVPPNASHRVGAIGQSIAVFVQPGSGGTAHREVGEMNVVTGRTCIRLVEAARVITRGEPREMPIALPELIDSVPHAGRVDRRVEQLLKALSIDPGLSIAGFAETQRMSHDRLTHLVTEATGIPPKRHALWQRVLSAMSARATPNQSPPSLASAAHAAGFTDHAHMTRSFRRFLGRAPSEFNGSPIVFAPGTDKLDQSASFSSWRRVASGAARSTDGP